MEHTRQIQLEAGIVRVMKREKSISLESLREQVPGELRETKQKVEELIEREYLRREEG